MDLYEYAVIRIVPDIEREEFLNIGLIMLCKRKRWLQIKTKSVPLTLMSIYDNFDHQVVSNNLKYFVGVGKGRPETGPVALMEPEERFRWLTAIKSAIIQTSRPHPGLTHTLQDTFDELFNRLVNTPPHKNLIEQNHVN